MNNNKKVNNGIVLISVVSVLAIIDIILQFYRIELRFKFPFDLIISSQNPFDLNFNSHFNPFDLVEIPGIILRMILPISLVASTIYYYYKKNTLFFYIPLVLLLIMIVIGVLQEVNLYLIYGYHGFYFFKVIRSIILQLLLITLLFIGLYRSRYLKGKVFIYLAIVPVVLFRLNNAYYLYKVRWNIAEINLGAIIANATLIGSYIMIVYFVEYDIRMSRVTTTPPTNTFTPSYNVHTEQRPTQRTTNSLEHIQILKELASLKDQGIITEEEFESKKRVLLDKI